MIHHITLKLVNGDDFKQLTTVIEGSGFKIFYLDSHALEVECQVDNFILSLVEKYLDAEVVYRKPSLVTIKDKLSREANLIKATG